VRWRLEDKRRGSTFGKTADAPHIRNFVPVKTGYRTPVFVRDVGHACETFCLSVPPYNNFIAGSGQGVVVSNCVDDPHSAQQARSDAERENALIWFDETMSTRLNDPKRGAKVVIMQRLHERDLSGHILEQGGYEHLCLPSEYEPDRHCITSVAEDQRTEAGEPIWPERMGIDDLAQQRSTLGEVGFAGQYQQRPMPRGGGMFPVDRFGITQHRPAPDQIQASVRFWDKAGSITKHAAFTAGVLMHRLKDGSYIVTDVVRGQWSAGEREKRIRQTAEMDGTSVKVWVEQEPGSGGKESAESTIRNLSGYSVHAERVTGDKESRAEPYSAQVEGGNVWLVQSDWNRDFVKEHETFPAGAYKDQVDAAAGAFAKLQRQGGEIRESEVRGLM